VGADPGHRGYPPDFIAAIEVLSCLRGTGLSLRSMHAYVVNMRRGAARAAEQRRLLADRTERLSDEIVRLQLHEQYVSDKAELWAAREAEDATAEVTITPIVIDRAAKPLDEEGGEVDE
jgi:DNA-binding transcriptional MerR regulator